MSSAPGMCQAYPVYTSDAPEDVSTALHGSGEGSLCTQGHASCGAPLYAGVLAQSHMGVCLLYTSPSPRDVEESRMPGSA